MGSKRLSFGGKLIVVSIWIAIASIFVGWVRVSLFASDVTSGPLIAVGIVIVFLLWGYPLQIATNRKRMSMKALVATATSAVVIPVVLGVIIDQRTLFDAGPGIVVLILAGMLLLVGILLDQLQLRFGKQEQASSRSDIQSFRFSRCCWVSEDDLQRHVRVQVFHATGHAYFALEPSIALLENKGLHPWALDEALALLQHYEHQIVEVWRSRSKATEMTAKVPSDGPMYAVGKTIGTVFRGLFGRNKKP
jgi:hypothetical protein